MPTEAKILIAAAMGAGVIALSFCAHAQAVPKDVSVYDMTIELKNEIGKPALDDQAADPETGKLCGVWKQVKDQPTELRASLDGCPTLTLGRAIAHALYIRFPDDAKLPEIEKLWAAQARLAEKIIDNKQAALTAGNVKRIETLMGRIYGPLILSQMYALIDPKALDESFEVK